MIRYLLDTDHVTLHEHGHPPLRARLAAPGTVQQQSPSYRSTSHADVMESVPLRDHFHSPLNDQTSWDLFHGQWPAMIVLRLNQILPPRYLAGPHVHLGTEIEIDVAGFEKEEPSLPPPQDGNGVAWQPGQPS